MDPTQAPAPSRVSREIPMYTATALNFQASAWVLRIAFGEIGDTDPLPEGQPMPEIFRLAVGLPWPLVKMLAKYLTLAIEAYERHEGPIVLPKSMEARLNAMIEAAKAEAAAQAQR